MEAKEFETKLEQIAEYEHDDTEQARADVENVLHDIGVTVNEWDREDVNELLALITLLKETARSWCMTEDLEYYGIRMDSLPSEQIPEIYLGYPVWAMDTRGYGLVGVAADEIEQLIEVE